MTSIRTIASLTALAPLALAGSCGASPPFELAGEPTPVGPMPTTPTLVDMNGDGVLDVVVACGPCCGISPDPLSGHVQVLLNDGKGGLRLAGERVKIGQTALNVAVGDLNHDGYADAVATHHGEYAVAVMLGNGTGDLSTPRMFDLWDGESPHVHSVALADANNDGNLDILATLVDDHSLAVHLGDGKGGFRPALGQPFFAQQHPYMQLNPVDMNGDGNVDVVLTDVRGNGVTVLAGSGTGMFASSKGFMLGAHTPIECAERPIACSLGDLDGDGDQDLVAVIDESPLAVRLINNGGTFTVPNQPKITLAEAAVGCTLADVNGDGVLDLVVSTTMTNRISISPGNGDGTFGSSYPVDAHGRSPYVAVGDMNGDGRPDIVTGNYESGTISVLLAREE